MRIQRLRLKGFKRFDDLTIDLGEHPARIVALVGPNGCGKSSVFDAFEERLKDVKGASQGSESPSFFSKFMFHSDPQLLSQQYNKSEAIQVTMEGQAQVVTKKTFHIRSAYRFTSKLDVKNISAQPDLLDDTRRPMSSIAIDSRLQENYERLLGLAYAEFERGTKPGNVVRAELLGQINEVLTAVLDVRVSTMGNVIEGKGQLYFEKDDAKEFPYQNLSSGEKEVIDIIVDLIVRGPEFDDTIYCIDEPELHLNTAIQRKLLVAIEHLIPPHCQLWIATHSIGFLRALQDQLAGECAVLDFAEKNYFRGAHTMRPVASTRAHWQRIFETALDDLVGLIAPDRIVYCEGRPDPDSGGGEQGLDATVYNEAFGSACPTTLFISSGGTGEIKRNGSLAIKVLSKALTGVELLVLRDRDVLTEAQRSSWVGEATHHRMLTRREIENYLLDYEVLSGYCAAKGRTLDRADYNAIVSDILTQDLKMGDITHRLKLLCGEAAFSNDGFKRALAPFVPGTAAFADLKRAIFIDPLTATPVTSSGIATAPVGLGGPAS